MNAKQLLETLMEKHGATFDCDSSEVLETLKNALGEIDFETPQPIQRRTKAELREGLVKAMAGFEGKLELSDPKEFYIQQFCESVADCLERLQVSQDRVEAERAFGLGVSLVKFKKYCADMKGKFSPRDGKVPTARWVVNGFEDWNARGAVEKTKVTYKRLD